MESSQRTAILGPRNPALSDHAVCAQARAGLRITLQDAPTVAALGHIQKHNACSEIESDCMCVCVCVSCIEPNLLKHVAHSKKRPILRKADEHQEENLALKCSTVGLKECPWSSSSIS